MYSTLVMFKSHPDESSVALYVLHVAPVVFLRRGVLAVTFPEVM